jgi:alpha-amylase/alpha-mannosidase (GH57 family)
MDRYVCIHGHFYQPPRENPWLEAIELQDSAYPYHDWNERITAECYLPNATARILDAEGRITKILNNYAKISFNFGPTLLGWMEENQPEIYGAILEADRESQRNFSGHGSALAQGYNHMILPLANRRDKITQVLWGIQDFVRRFGRSPEGFWLPETAVDLETLAIMAGLGIRFTILSPYQARRVRKMRSRIWRDVSGGRIDPSMAYELRLPHRLKIAVFFYDGPISGAVAFERLLANGEQFAARIMNAFSDDRTWPQLAHIATDGETYGHHHRHGDMALAYALHHLETNHLARLTNYGEFLERHPATHEVEIFENSSWSCFHGVERWKGDCGCRTGMNPQWNQGWRAPLRESLNGLRDRLSSLFEEKGRQFFSDPWKARDHFISILHNRSAENVERFLQDHEFFELPGGDRIQALKLLELQRHAMLMFTSCGWFFDELSGIETVQVLQYAGRAIQLAQELCDDGLEEEFLGRLERARSNIPEHGDGRRIYEKFVKPATVNLDKVAAHYAIRSLFEPYAEHDRIYAYEVDREDFKSSEAGKMKLALGRARFTSRITRESASLSFGVLHFGDHNLNGGVRKFEGEEGYGKLVQRITEAFSRAEIAAVIRLLDRDFSQHGFNLRSLFRDEQRKILGQILDSTFAEAEAHYRQIYERYATLMRFLTDLGAPLPKSFLTAAEFALNLSIRQALEAEDSDLARVQALLEEAKRLKVPLERVSLGYALKGTIERMMEDLQAHPQDLIRLEKLERITGLARSLPFDVDFWKVQNIFYRMTQTDYQAFRDRAAKGEEAGRNWIFHFSALGENLSCWVE